MASDLESDLIYNVDWCRKWLVDFNAGKTQLVSFDWSNNTGAIDVKMDGFVLEEKSPLRYWGWLSFLNWIGALALSQLLKLPLRLLCVSKTTKQPCMECYYHVWAGAPSCFLELLDKLQKRIWRTVRASLATSLEPLVIIEILCL